jgi:hypothetical protein
MATGNFFSAVAAKLFGSAPDDRAKVEPELVELAIEAVIDTVDPRLRTVSGYRKKLAPGAAATIRHLRSIAPQLPAALELSRSAWTSDSTINALFATADAVRSALGRSPALRTYFESNTAADEVYALLGMLKVERNVFAPALIDGQLRHDVAQTTVSFSNHKLVAPAPDSSACRREVGMLILQRLATLALERITALGELATGLEQRKAVLAARLRLLKLRKDGIEQLAGAADESAEAARIEHELKATAGEVLEAKTQLATLATRIDHVNAVLNAPADNVNLANLELRVNKTGFKLAANSEDTGAVLKLTELAIGNGEKIIIAFVRCRRAEMPPKESLAARAAREVL